MPSPEDIKALTVSSPASPSSSAPEEFRVEPHQDQGNESSSAAPLPSQSVPVEIRTTTSPENPSTEPSEDGTVELNTKPLPKVNAVAREVRVKATGARPGDVAGERELFTESTATVLVFEKGAVIRLAAAVAPAQLLFLTNEESKREVVAQVMRKRTFRPTECYVELQFTEPAPGFWGVEFSAATALLPKDAKEIMAAELVASAETTTDELGEPAPPPGADEILALKKEVDALRSQLRLLQTQATIEQAAPTPAIPDIATPVVTSTPPAETARATSEPAPRVVITAKSLPTAREPQPTPVTMAAPELLPRPALDFSVSLPKRKRSFKARGNFTPGFRTGALRLAILTCALLVTIVGAAWYKHWLPWMPESRKIPVASWMGLLTSTKPVSEVHAAGPGTAPAQTGNTESGKDISVSPNAASENHTQPSRTVEQLSASDAHADDASLPVESVSQPVLRGKSKAPASTTKRSAIHVPAIKPADPVPIPVTDSANLPPRLIKSERAEVSLEDLRDFETGSVLIDAIIDTAGDVTSMHVLSGPPSLRQPAMWALKNYKYLPAMQNGKPVPAHVTVKIQFHFE